MSVFRLFRTSGFVWLSIHRSCLSWPISWSKMLGYVAQRLDGIILCTVAIPSDTVCYVARWTNMSYDFLDCVFACAIWVFACSTASVFVWFLISFCSAMSVGMVLLVVPLTLLKLWRPGCVNLSSVMKFHMCGACVARSIETIMCTPYSSITG